MPVEAGAGANTPVVWREAFRLTRTVPSGANAVYLKVTMSPTFAAAGGAAPPPPDEASAIGRRAQERAARERRASAGMRTAAAGVTMGRPG